MHCPPITQNQNSYCHSELARPNYLDRLPKYLEVQALQNRACSSLCELSDNICAEKSQNLLRRKKLSEVFSPWNLKMREESGDSVPGVEGRKEASGNFSNKKLNNYISLENKQNAIYKEQSFKKSSSVFLKIFPNREKQPLPKMKGERTEFELITCMKRKKSLETKPSQESTKIKSSIAVQTNFDHMKTSEECEFTKKRDLNRFPMKNISCELFEEENKKESKQFFQSRNDYWKKRNLSKKCRKTKVSRVIRDFESSELRSNKELISLSKKSSLSKNKERQYHCSNPLTKLLYEKYLNTIYLNEKIPK